MAAIENFEHVIVQPFTFKYLCPTLLPSGCIYAHPMAVFARNDIGFMGLLWSSIHWLWTNINCSTSLNLYRYTASSIVDTFPIFDCAESESVISSSKAFVESMTGLRTNNNLSQLDLLNWFNNPERFEDEITNLRQLRNNIDLSILRLYMDDTSSISHEFYIDKDRGISHYTFDKQSRQVVFEFLKLKNGEKQTTV